MNELDLDLLKTATAVAELLEPLNADKRGKVFGILGVGSSVNGVALEEIPEEVAQPLPTGRRKNYGPQGVRLHRGIKANVLGKAISEERLSRGMTIRAFGELVGVSRSAVLQWESGQSRPNVERMEIIAKALDKPVEYFTKAKKAKKV